MDTEKTPFIVIRLWPDHHKNARLLAELIEALDRNRLACDEVWFCTEPGLPHLEVHRRSAELMGRAAERVRSAGFLPGIQIGWTIGHGDGAYPADAMTWKSMVGHNGQAARTVSCPRAEGFLEYLAEMTRAYAAWGPSSVWIDDDLRMHFMPPVSYGCFCEDCLSAFAARQGRPWQRAELLEAMSSPQGAPLRREWVAMNQQALAEIARTIRRAVHAVSPRTRMGLQTSGPELSLHSGPDCLPIFEALGEDAALPLGSRPGWGFYTDHEPRGMLIKACYIARQIARLPESVTVVCPEVENFTHTAMGKSAHGTVVESTLDLAFGCNSLSYAIIASGHEKMSWYAQLLERIAAWRPFWEKYVQASAGTSPGGLAVAFGKDHAALASGNAKRPFAWAQVNLDPVYRLLATGLPLCVQGPAATATALHAAAIPGLSDEELERILGGGVLADGQAACELQERGFGPAMGLGVEKIEGPGCFERLTDDPLNGPHAGHLWQQYDPQRPQPVSLVPASPQARVLGRYVHAEGPEGEGPAATVITPTAGGGRLAVFGNNGWQHVVSSARRAQMLAAADWVSHDRLPVLIETPAQMAAVPRVDPQGRLVSVLLLNVSIDSSPPARVRLRRPPGTAITWVRPDADDQPLPTETGKDELVIEAPPLPAWSVGYLLAANAE